MDIETAYNKQLKIMEQMVNELKEVNVNLKTLNDNVNDLGQAFFENEIKSAIDQLFDVATGVVGGLVDFGEEVEEDVVYIGKEELIQLAKDDIESLLSTQQLPYKSYGMENFNYIPRYDRKNIQLISNPEKGTCVALFKDGSKVLDRGIARCHPDDDFHEEIGFAIALRRLFKLEVPQI